MSYLVMSGIKDNERFISDELKSICHQMSYGDDSKKTWNRYCELMNIIGTEEELEQKRQEAFYD